MAFAINMSLAAHPCTCQNFTCLFLLITGRAPVSRAAIPKLKLIVHVPCLIGITTVCVHVTKILNAVASRPHTTLFLQVASHSEMGYPLESDVHSTSLVTGGTECCSALYGTFQSQVRGSKCRQEQAPHDVGRRLLRAKHAHTHVSLSPQAVLDTIVTWHSPSEPAR